MALAVNIDVHTVNTSLLAIDYEVDYNFWVTSLCCGNEKLHENCNNNLTEGSNNCTCTTFIINT